MGQRVIVLPLILRQPVRESWMSHHGWWSADRHMNAGPKTEQVDMLRDNIICVEFKGIREAKEHACERR
ncbi:hypothetical protein XH97_01580 [Bradyrhizobium sp. CCBAU 53380]|nr:hypothetical protein [Bradyrhizobium sp. CCBAU 53380]